MKLGLALVLALAMVAPAFAGSEEFSTFSVFRQEEDDESLLDHLLARPPAAWRDEWERAPQALRTSQGCLTSGQWMIATELRTGAALGERARFGLEARDEQSDRSSFTYFDLSFRFPTPRGTPGFWFRPLFDKSRQDLGLFWEAGAETSAAYARVTFAFEDVFNNLWEFRQTRVGEASEPYEKHPFEPAFCMHLRGEDRRLEIEGQLLTPSRKRIGSDSLTYRTRLWGAYGRVATEWRAMGVTWSASGENRQARSVEPWVGVAIPSQIEEFRRQWAAEAAASRRFGALWEGELRWVYQRREGTRTGTERLYLPAARLDAVERVLQIEARRRIAGAWAARAGALLDRITVAATGTSGLPTSFFTYGSRNESRAYLGLSARFGKVSLDVVEGFELDPEPYEVWWVHDKAFAHLQTAF